MMVFLSVAGGGSRGLLARTHSAWATWVPIGSFPPMSLTLRRFSVDRPTAGPHSDLIRFGAVELNRCECRLVLSQYRPAGWFPASMHRFEAAAPIRCNPEVAATPLKTMAERNMRDTSERSTDCILPEPSWLPLISSERARRMSPVGPGVEQRQDAPHG